jgi:hypothetical protein
MIEKAEALAEMVFSLKEPIDHRVSFDMCSFIWYNALSFLTQLTSVRQFTRRGEEP